MIDAENRGFQGLWIPATLWNDESLSRLEIEILADVASFDAYYKSNEAMAEFFKVSARRIRDVLLEMEEKNLIKRYMIKADKGNCVGRIISITDEQHAKMYPSPASKGVGKKTSGGEEENFRRVGKKTSSKNTYIEIPDENTYESVCGDADAFATRTHTRNTRFVKPTVEEIQAYLDEKGYILDAEYFWNFYESKGWMVGKNPMKNWKACVATWVRTDKRRRANNGNYGADDGTEQEDYSYLDKNIWSTEFTADLAGGSGEPQSENDTGDS